MDAEFIAQALCLENGWQEANTLRALERAREAGSLPDAEKLLDNYRKLRRVEGILRQWSYEGETVLPDDRGGILPRFGALRFLHARRNSERRWRNGGRQSARFTKRFSTQKKRTSRKAVGSTRLRRVQFGVPPN